MCYDLFKDASRACGIIAALHHDSPGSCIKCSLKIRVETQPAPPTLLLQLVASGTVWSLNPDAPQCRQVNNAACILKVN